MNGFWQSPMGKTAWVRLFWNRPQSGSKLFLNPSGGGIPVVALLRPAGTAFPSRSDALGAPASCRPGGRQSPVFSTKRDRLDALQLIECGR